MQGNRHAENIAKRGYPGMNFFAHPNAAKRYAFSRPYFHPIVIKRIKEYLHIDQAVKKALDVGCGTGQSTIALKAIAEEIVGAEISQAMLDGAIPDERITYLQAPAEELPLDDDTIDLITVSMAFHWFERDKFLDEAARILHPRGWLVIYNNCFLGKMRENPAFEDWAKQTYLQRFPTPKRNRKLLSEQDVETHGLRLVGHEEYCNEIKFSCEELASYLMSQSNVIALVENKSERAEEVYTWLLEQLKPLFQFPRGTFLFSGSITYVQKRG
jgi:ubiquinone/menaquinone biosynthesis C-methylase UbiE